MLRTEHGNHTAACRMRLEAAMSGDETMRQTHKTRNMRTRRKEQNHGVARSPASVNPDFKVDDCEKTMHVDANKDGGGMNDSGDNLQPLSKVEMLLTQLKILVDNLKAVNCFIP